jgi:hypothetical protein
VPTSRILPESDLARTGGLSGVAHDPVGKRWLAIADSRKVLRAYAFDFVVDASGFHARPLGAHEIVRGPSSQVGGVLDFEGITVLPDGRIILSSEGDCAPTTFRTRPRRIGATSVSSRSPCAIATCRACRACPSAASATTRPSRA